jgi:putative radical SAM enzyme (TIGR03279 family)
MHGNYVTLTNISEAEWHRILEQRLSPLYVSVHATDPDLRAKLLGRKEPTPILPQLRELADNRIHVHAQIVLCPTLNDGAALEQTLNELAQEHPSTTGKRAGVDSVAIVPVGMTQFRERLPHLQKVERDYAREMIATVRRKERAFNNQLGTRFVWLADEWYHIAEMPYPGRAHYEEFPQLEDGIGTVRLFLDDAKRLSPKLPECVPEPIRATLITAAMPAPVVRGFAHRLSQIEGVEINVCVIENHYFGGDIHIAGLITATDIIAQLKTFPECHSVVYVPRIAVRDDSVFLDDYSLEEVRQETGKDIRIVGHNPRALAEALGLVRPSSRDNTALPSWIMEENLVS